LTTWHCILSTELTKTHSLRLFFGDFDLLGLINDNFFSPELKNTEEYCKQHILILQRTQDINATLLRKLLRHVETINNFAGKPY